AHDVPLGCAPDEYDDLISGTCSHLPLLVVVIWLFILHKVGGEPEALCNDLILKLNTVWLYRFMHPKQT
ncbi:hypothetical protein ABVM38_26380, partial [Klebsiella pneumoniae]